MANCLLKIEEVKGLCVSLVPLSKRISAFYYHAVFLLCYHIISLSVNNSSLTTGDGSLLSFYHLFFRRLFS